MSKVNSELLDHQLEAEAPMAEANCPRLRKMWGDEMKQAEPNVDVKFQFALTLIKTRSQHNNREGLSLLQGLADCSYHVEECYYSMALGLYRMGKYQECRDMVEVVLRMDPDMPSAQTLHKATIEAAARRRKTDVAALVAGGAFMGGIGIVAALLLNNENVMAMAAGGAAVAGLGILLGAVLSRR